MKHRLLILFVFLFFCFGFKETGTTKYGNKTIKYEDGKKGIFVSKDTFGSLRDCHIKNGYTKKVHYFEEAAMVSCYFVGYNKFTAKTMIEDIDKDGKFDFVILYIPQPIDRVTPGLTFSHAWEYALISTALVSLNTDWPSGKLYFVFSAWGVGSHYRWAYTKDCRKCLKYPNAHMARKCSVNSRKELTDKKIQKEIDKLLGW